MMNVAEGAASTLATLEPLVGFAVWTIVLVLCIGIWRVMNVLAGKGGPGAFPGGVKHGSEAYWRLNRAHMNCVENLPVFAVLAFAGLQLGVADMNYAWAAHIVLAARIVQSLIHIASGAAIAVTLRFLAFGVQIACFGYMAHRCLALGFALMHNGL